MGDRNCHPSPLDLLLPSGQRPRFERPAQNKLSQRENRLALGRKVTFICGRGLRPRIKMLIKGSPF